MKTVFRALAFILCLSVLAYGQGNSFEEIRYNGGTVETKVSPKDWDNRLSVTSDEIKLELKDGQTLIIDPKRVKGLSYGQEAHRRVGTMIALGILVAPLALFGLFHKTRLHFVGIEYTTADGKKAGVLLQAHKKNYRAVLTALRGSTGAPIAVAEEDRKYVPVGIDAVSVKEGDQSPEEKQPVSSAGNSQTQELGKIQMGMDPAQVESILGSPSKIRRSFTSTGTVELWEYSDQPKRLEVSFREGKVEKVEEIEVLPGH